MILTTKTRQHHQRLHCSYFSIPYFLLFPMEKWTKKWTSALLHEVKSSDWSWGPFLRPRKNFLNISNRRPSGCQVWQDSVIHCSWHTNLGGRQRGWYWPRRHAHTTNVYTAAISRFPIFMEKWTKKWTGCSFVFRLKLGFHCFGTRKSFRRDYLDYFKLLGKIRQNLEIAGILIHFTFFSLGQSVEKLILLPA